jgi:hypothetical protein
MNETWTVKILEEKLGGRRGRGRPRLSWIDAVEDDVRDMGIRRWRESKLWIEMNGHQL